MSPPEIVTQAGWAAARKQLLQRENYRRRHGWTFPWYSSPIGAPSMTTFTSRSTRQ
jgi:predicted dithiol-disulfide oxidoreductase (DUF899 family)